MSSPAQRGRPVRVRREAMRRAIAGVPAVPSAVPGPLGESVHAAARSLRPIVEAGILPFPEVDPEGVAALWATGEALG
jgi:hypothetical protein